MAVGGQVLWALNKHTSLIRPSLRFDRIGRFNVDVGSRPQRLSSSPSTGLAGPLPSLCPTLAAAVQLRGLLLSLDACRIWFTLGDCVPCAMHRSQSSDHLDHMGELKSHRRFRQRPRRRMSGHIWSRPLATKRSWCRSPANACFTTSGPCI